ncbi:MAG: MMPL family transporter [Acidimicrobiales bacterium]
MAIASSTQVTARRRGEVEPENSRLGALGRLGTWAATHLRAVLVGWAVVLVVFGFFAPRVEGALAGAGWQDSSSQSVAARGVIGKDFAGLGSSALQVVVVDDNRAIAADPAARSTLSRVAAMLGASRDVSTVVMPRPGATLSANGRTAVVIGGAAAGTNTMVRAAASLAGPLSRLSRPGISVNLTGDSALWAQFNSANRSAMLRSEVLSWPVTMIVLVIAFGSLVAAGLPLMLTMAGLLVAAGALVLANHIAPVSIWALNFALMFALALGIDYSLFLVVRFRSALLRRRVAPGDRTAVAASVAETMATAGKAVAFSALTVLLSLSAVLLVPSPAFRSMALGIMLAVLAVLAATVTLLPAVLGRLGTRVNAGSVRLNRRSRPASHGLQGLEGRLHSWATTLWRHPLAVGVAGLVVMGSLIFPLFGLRTSMPSITIIPSASTAATGYRQVVAAFGPGAPGTLQVVVPAGEQPAAMRAMRQLPGVAGVLSGPTNRGYTLDQAVPTTGPSTAATGATIDRLRAVLPHGSLVGGAAAENHDLSTVLASRTPMVFGLLGLIGFLLLLVALGSPWLALAGIAITGLSVAAAFGVARLIFQNGDLSGILGFVPQGFVDAWGPIFFGAMVTGVAMDYTLFLLSAAKEHYETHADPEQALVDSMRTSGRVVVSAAAIMVAVFLTFALSGPLAPKEMGVILAVAVLVDALAVRLLLLPVILRLGGHWIWSRPRWLGRFLPEVSFRH